ncbi:MAG TPA: C25 family cysteine peptidase [Thermoanaerobaculia bacterium]
MRFPAKHTSSHGLGRAAATLLVAAALFTATGHGFAASTGQTALFMPQGSGAGTANGDFVTANGGGGLNTFYRYFIEVPPGLARLRVQIFDPDLGVGGTAEAAAQRDRARNAFNTSVTYTLIRPDGSTATGTPITCNAATCTDNGWQDLLNSTAAADRAAGHWELQVNESSAVTAGDDINGIGIRADDQNGAFGGTELPIYYDSQSQYGVNPPASGTTDRNYTYYPYITSGCSFSENDFDYDSDAGNTGAITLSSRTAAFSQTIASAALSVNNTWARNNVTGWTSDANSLDYGIWQAAIRITSYVNGNGQNGNYANIYFANFNAAANPPAANPTPNTFRVYFPNNGGTAPVKPYLEQQVRFLSGPNPPAVNQTTRVTVTLRLVNPTSRAIAFSTPTNIVTANVPGAGAIYAGPIATSNPSQGSIVSQPAVGGTGNITWNPGSLAAGATAILAYNVDVKPTSAGQRVPVTATPASGNGTRAQWLDETANATQARATFLFGPVCELAATQGMLTAAVVSSFHTVADGNAVAVEWKTASEAGTLGYYLYRRDAASGRWVKAHDGLLASLVGAPQGGAYRFRDEGASARGPQTYLLVEVAADGRRRVHGPYTVTAGATDAADTAGLDRSEAPFARAPHRGARREAAESSGQPELAQRIAAPLRTGARIGVRQSGLYFVGSADLATALGVTQRKVESLIDKGALSLTRNGQPVAWLADTPPGRKADGILFYGQAIDSLYSAENVYRITASGKGLTMALEPTAAAGAGGPASFAASLHAEQDAFPATALPLDPESDYWFWDFVIAGDPTFGSKTFSLDAPGLAAGGTAALTVNLHGASASGVSGEHHVTVSLNGTAVGEVHFDGITAKTATFSVDPALLHPTGNQVVVQDLLDAGVPFSIVYVDSFDLGYPRSFQAQGDALAFNAAGAGTPIAIGGFSSAAVRVLDLGAPDRPRLVAGASTGSDGAGGTAVRFIPASPSAPYLAAGPGGLLHPASLRPWLNEGLASTSNRADYLVLTTSALAPAADRLAAYHAAQGLASMVVDVEAVMNEWNGGLNDPHAIAAFLAYARSRWATPPRYVVLAGAGSLDYRNLLGNGDSLVPPIMVAETEGLFPSDSRFVDSGNGVPAIAIGRIPAVTAAELDAYVDKLIAYEADSGAGWSGRASLVSDAPDQGTDFAAGTAQLTGLLRVGTTADRIDLGTTALADARSALLADLGQGTALINYLGHGGLDRLASGGLLDSADVPGLTNGPRLPVLTAMTCVINRFAVPGIRSLGEMLVVQPGGGAAAVWAPTGLSLAGEAPLLAERFYRLTGDPTADRSLLGDLVVRSLAEFKQLGGSSSMLDVYSLLGDPALHLKRTPNPLFHPAAGTGE